MPGSTVLPIDDSATFTLEPPRRSPSVHTDDRRIFGRTGRTLAVTLLGLGKSDEACCILTDLSEGGVRVQVPTAVRLGVGQRVEVVMSENHVGADLAGHFSGGCFATVVRTEREDAATPGYLAAGLRFDQPLMF